VAFPDAQELIGVDTSPEMISMAKFLWDHQCRMQPIADFVSEGFNLHTKSLEQPLTEMISEWSTRISNSLRFKGTSMKVKRVYVRAKQAMAKFTLANAEETSLPANSFDLVTIM